MINILDGYIIFAVYFISMTAITVYYNKKKDLDEFLVASRNVGTIPNALSIAATWIWAPALFVSAQKAYQQGIAGLFWFIVPNIACLILFGYLSAKLKDKFPQGYTLSQFMKHRYNTTVQRIYNIELLVVLICCCAVQLLAGSQLIAPLTGLSHFEVTFWLAVITLIYSAISGTRASIVTDIVQMVFMLVVSVTIIPYAVYENGGITSIINGIGGLSGKYTNILDPVVLMSFGIPVAIGLLAGQFGDQSFWQRVWSAKDTRKSFYWSALFFAIVPLSLSMLGFVAAGIGYKASNVAMVGFEIVEGLGYTAVVVFVFMIIAGLGSTLDGALCAISSIATIDFASKSKYQSIIARVSMIALTVIAIGIANIPQLTILHLFLLYGTIRATTLVPTILTIVSNPTANGMIKGIIGAMLVGVPVFAYGNFYNVPMASLIGSLLTVGISGFTVWYVREEEPTNKEHDGKGWEWYGS